MTSKQPSPCVIIGGSGFLGQRLKKLLATSSDWTPTVTDLTKADQTCDVTRLASVVDAVRGADLVINLAAVHHDNVRPISRYYEVNVEGARNVCDACRQLGISRQVFISSVAVYGDTRGEPATETTPHHPFNHYGKSKSQAEDVYRSWFEEEPRRNLIIIRPTVIFGENNRGNLYNLMNSIAQNKFRMVGDGNVVKSVAYVDNVAAFIQFSVASCETGMHIFNYADEPSPTTGELVNSIRDELGMHGERLRKIPYWLAYLGGMGFDVMGKFTPLKSPVSTQRVRKFCSPTPIETTRVRKLGFRPAFPVMEALRRTVQYEFGPRPQVPMEPPSAFRKI